MQALFAKIRRPSLRYGLIFGLILGGIQIVFGLVTLPITQENILSVLSTIGLALFLVLGFNAGQRATRETGKLGTGVAAGIWTGLVGALLAAFVPFVLTLINLPTIISTDKLYIKAHPSQFPGYNPANFAATDVFADFLATLLPTLLFYIVITLLGSTLGGVLGRRRAPVSPSQEPSPSQEA